MKKLIKREREREIKSRRIVWLGHLERMEEQRMNGVGSLCTVLFESSEDVKLGSAS